jgi:hypothetical protein
MAAGIAPQPVKEKGVRKLASLWRSTGQIHWYLLAILDAKRRAMELKTFTYEKTLNAYYLRQTRGRQTLEDHIAEMLQQGWKIMSGPTPVAKTPRRGRGLPGDAIIIVFKKD